MANDVMVFDPSKFSALKANMARAASSQVGFLKMDKTGAWSFGSDENPVGEDDRVYVDPNGFVHGWQCWADTDIPGVQSELLGDVKVSMFEPLPPRPDEEYANMRPWTEMRGMSVLLDGNKLVYSTTSVGGLNTIAKLAEEYAKQYAKNPKKMIAVLSLSSDSYKHKNKTYGRIYTPVMEVVEWVDRLPEEIAVKAIADAKASAKKPAPAKKAAPAAPAKGAKAAPAKTPAKAAKKST